ncbi:putative transporter [Zancudomyces culisetae]|uniref:Putative transporter n=1 Tax=Zancudomyces culisetae TaxID=1213189 RepID=A0A1R1PR95_ZANCU|nr:putative transporter [Zancudomyces culisetae]|eukprot:OMH83495.1 putative transporter [Zancudomyces culisetae]
MMTWTSINMGGTAKRLISIAVISALASAGNMVAPILYTGDYGPEFTEGGLLLILSHAASIVSALVLAYHFKRTNKYRDEHPIDVSHLTEEEQVALNDYHPNFRYRL